MLTAESIGDRLRPLLAETEFELVDLKVQGGQGRPKFVIVLDHRSRNITIREIETWSRRFEDEFDMADDIPRSYALDVTSPGIGHPLSHDWEFAKNIGRKLEIELDPEEGEKKSKVLKAVLEAVEGDMLVLEGDQRIDRKDVRQAKVSLPW